MSYRVFCDRPASELVDGKPAAAAAEASEGDNAAAIMEEDGEEAEADKVCFLITPDSRLREFTQAGYSQSQS